MKQPLSFVRYTLPLLALLIVAGVGALILWDRADVFDPSLAKLVWCDAGWYKGIAENGYYFSANSANSTAFFPLFPYFWRWTHLNDLGISIANGALFLCGFYLLQRFYPAKIKTTLLYLSLSLLLFYMVPFSESLFFLFTAVLFGGFYKKSPSLSIIGIIGAGLTRSVCTIFLPAFLLLAVIRYTETKSWKAIKWYLVYALVSLLTLFTVFFIHWYQTGHFWAFTYTQRFWNTAWRIPDIPFSSWDPKENGYYDQYALLLSVLCTLFMAWMLFVLIKGKKIVRLSDAEWFSLLYMAGIGLLMIFTRGGICNSMNRYIFATPFFYLFIRMLEQATLKKAVLIPIAVFAILYHLIVWHMGVGIQEALVAVIMVAATTGIPYLVQYDTLLTRIIAGVVIIAMLYIQAFLWYSFVSGVWVG